MPHPILNAMDNDDLQAIYWFIRYLGPSGKPVPDFEPAGWCLSMNDIFWLNKIKYNKQVDHIQNKVGALDLNILKAQNPFYSNDVINHSRNTKLVFLTPYFFPANVTNCQPTLFFWLLKNVSSASITTPVMVVLFADAKPSILSASLQGIWTVNSLVKSEHWFLKFSLFILCTILYTFHQGEPLSQTIKIPIITKTFLNKAILQ